MTGEKQTWIDVDRRLGEWVKASEETERVKSFRCLLEGFDVTVVFIKDGGKPRPLQGRINVCANNRVVESLFKSYLISPHLNLKDEVCWGFKQDPAAYHFGIAHEVRLFPNKLELERQLQRDGLAYPPAPKRPRRCECNIL